MKLKDKKIEILKPVTVVDSEGFSETTLQPIDGPLWAYFRQLSGKEVFAAATQLQGRSAVHCQLPHRHNDRLCRAVQGRSLRHYPHRHIRGVQRGLEPVLQQAGWAVVKFYIMFTGYIIEICRRVCYTIFYNFMCIFKALRRADA